MILTDHYTSVNDAVCDLFFRSGGTNNTDTSSYIAQYLYAQSTTRNAARETSNTGALCTATANTESNAFAIHIFNPYQATTTEAQSHGWYYVNGGRDLTVTIQHTTASSFDGFALEPRSGTVTGTLYLYGYSKS